MRTTGCEFERRRRFRYERSVPLRKLDPLSPLKEAARASAVHPLAVCVLRPVHPDHSLRDCVLLRIAERVEAGNVRLHVGHALADIEATVARQQPVRHALESRHIVEAASPRNAQVVRVSFRFERSVATPQAARWACLPCRHFKNQSCVRLASVFEVAAFQTNSLKTIYARCVRCSAHARRGRHGTLPHTHTMWRPLTDRGAHLARAPPPLAQCACAAACVVAVGIK